ncbi:MAG TPA: hypothetical protein VME66_05750 [Candidatus Acidoferrales bacterium]|nr:hypothetical protein [Candidatus Acidoferrales bacterium]
MPVLRVNFLVATRKARNVIGYVVEDAKVLGRRSWNLPVNDDVGAARLLEFDRQRARKPDKALMHLVLSFPDGTCLTPTDAFEYFDRLRSSTALAGLPTVAAAHTGRPHLHAVISRVAPSGRLIPIPIPDLLERERELALQYGLSPTAPRQRPMPASIVNARKWEGHYTFADYMRAFPWPEPTGNLDADRAAISSLLTRVGVAVVSVNGGWRLRHEYGGREDRAKASVVVPPALRHALTPLSAELNHPRGYGALRAAGKLVMPKIKNGPRYAEVVEANERSAKGLGYWDLRLSEPPPTWVEPGSDSNWSAIGEHSPAVIKRAPVEGSEERVASNNDGTAVGNDDGAADTKRAGATEKLLGRWAAYLDAEGVSPERVEQLVSKHANAISSYSRLAGDLKMRGRIDSNDLAKSVLVVAGNAAMADFALAAASLNLEKPLYSPGEFSTGDDIKGMVSELSGRQIAMALGRGESALPIGPRAMSVAQALASVTRISTAASADQGRTWSIREEPGVPDGSFLERTDGYHFESGERGLYGGNAIRVALLMAAAEGGGAVTLTGNEAFRSTVCSMAAQLGIAVMNSANRFADADGELAYRKARASSLKDGAVSRDHQLQHLLGAKGVGSQDRESIPLDQAVTLVDLAPMTNDGLTPALTFRRSLGFRWGLVDVPSGRTPLEKGAKVRVDSGRGGRAKLESVKTERAQSVGGDERRVRVSSVQAR